jgi:hypothetical protein
MVTVAGEKLSEPATCTAWLADVYPDAEALIVADPKLTPVTWGCVAGATDPPAISTFSGATATLEVSLLLNTTVTPPDGAGVVNVTGNVADWFVPTDMPLDSVMLPGAADEFVSVNAAVLASPAVDAVTGYVPASPFAVRVCDRATPDESVVAVFRPLANVALAPLPGAVNVTATPLTGFGGLRRAAGGRNRRRRPCPSGANGHGCRDLRNVRRGAHVDYRCARRVPHHQNHGGRIVASIPIHL